MKNKKNREKRGVEGKSYSFKYRNKDENTIIIRVENDSETEEFEAFVFTNGTLDKLNKLKNSPICLK